MANNITEKTSIPTKIYDMNTQFIVNSIQSLYEEWVDNIRFVKSTFDKEWLPDENYGDYPQVTKKVLHNIINIMGRSSCLDYVSHIVGVLSESHTIEEQQKVLTVFFNTIQENLLSTPEPEHSLDQLIINEERKSWRELYDLFV